MKGKRRQHSPEFKAKVALAALRGDKTANQLASEHDIHPLLVGQWKKAAVEGLAEVFASRRAVREKDTEELTASLYQQIGQLKVELDWLKKKSGLAG
jgi:transposase-like protein